MKYISIADLAKTIRRNFSRIPHDLDFVIGVPRSGVLAGSIIAELLNIPLIDVDSFVFGASPTGGRRVCSRMNFKDKPKVLVVDDTIFNGGSMYNARKKLEPLNDRYEFVFCAVYLEGPCKEVDIWLEDLRQYTEHFSSFVLYEWNILHHIPRFMKECIFDCDGVFCVDPPNDKHEEQYLEYIKDATPLFIPTASVGEIVSYRISKNEEITRDWLDSHGVKYEKLTLFPAGTREERNSSGISPAQFKAKIYRDRIWAQLFVESDDVQAREINRLSGKPVYCVSSNNFYE